MHHQRLDPHRFVSYYENQVGGDLPGFYGAPVMYGRGIGSLFSRLFRFAAPLLKRGFTAAKPHLATAAKNIASQAVTHVMSKINNNGEPQEGSGGIMVLARRPRKKPPGVRVRARRKAPSRRGRKPVGGVRAKGRTSKTRKARDIFL